MLARAVREKPGEVKLGEVEVSRQRLAEARMEDIKDVWDAIDRGFRVYSLKFSHFNAQGCHDLWVDKFEFERESVGTRLSQILAYTENEFKAEAGAEDESSYNSSTSGEDGDSESGEEEEGHDGGEDGGEEEDLGEEGGQGGD